ncbi:MAG TPA: hypothetical protein GXZ76_01990 [Clostridiaceae bacterium]|jgi:hypothetical protein|nr:hypothetical protein [Clostridiaceae bacterium]
MKKENKKSKFLDILGIILQGIGFLFLAVLINLFLREREQIDWTGTGFGIIVFVAFIIIGRILCNKNNQNISNK